MFVCTAATEIPLAGFAGAWNSSSVWKPTEFSLYVCSNWIIDWFSHLNFKASALLWWLQIGPTADGVIQYFRTSVAPKWRLQHSRERCHTRKLEEWALLHNYGEAWRRSKLRPDLHLLTVLRPSNMGNQLGIHYQQSATILDRSGIAWRSAAWKSAIVKSFVWQLAMLLPHGVHHESSLEYLMKGTASVVNDRSYSKASHMIVEARILPKGAGNNDFYAIKLITCHL